MNKFSHVVLCLALSITGVDAQIGNTAFSQPTTVTVPPPTTPQIASTGANFNVWQWQTFIPLGNGTIVSQNHSYTELASGLNYQDPSSGNWVPAQAMIQPYVQGAIAQQGQHQIIFANNLNSSGAIDEQTPDGKRLTSNVLGLMYYDPATG